MKKRVAAYLPALRWIQGYNGDFLTRDIVAAAIVTIMLIPQSLAYALLAGLPPQAGLYASILPLVAYAVFGTSNTLAVGPVAVLSLMTASAAGSIAIQGSPQYAGAALILALLSGIILLILGLLRFGFLSNFLSHPVITGFITATGIIIAASQLKHLLGIEAGGHNIYEIAVSLIARLPSLNPWTLLIGIASLVLLLWTRSRLQPLLVRLGVNIRFAGIMAKTGPMLTVIAGALVVAAFRLDQHGVQIVGSVPAGLPVLTLPPLDMEMWKTLAGPAALIAVVGFVESVSVARTLASRRRERIDPDQELVGLGAAGIAAGLSGGYPVTGGFARSAVNFDAGARTPAAGFFTALGIAIATLSLTPMIFFLPRATLAATIIVAVTAIIDISVLRKTWTYSREDFAAVSGTILMTLLFGVEVGISSGVLLSIALFLYRTSRPHIAEVGLVPETEHFRNIRRHDVLTCPSVLVLRVDESLYFANAGNLEDYIYNRVVADCELRHVVLMCSAINEIDSSALESLEAINHRLNTIGIRLHLSEVKGPVMDRLKRTDFLEQLTGKVFLSQYQAFRELADRHPEKSYV